MQTHCEKDKTKEKQLKQAQNTKNKRIFNYCILIIPNIQTQAIPDYQKEPG